MSKTTKGILQMALATVAGALACTLFFLFIISGAFAVLAPNPSRPQITYGEFPFRLTFELDGELQVIEDTIVCEFVGFESRGTAGRYRVWEAHLKSGAERITLLNLRHLEETNELGQLMLELFFDWGNANYYMGDTSRWPRGGQNFYEIMFLFQSPDGRIGGSAYEADVAWEKYGIRLIDWEVSSPIENTFRHWILRFLPASP
ncbi:MAG: hypothetical protein FWC66_05010 [Oscillospiraceae bacterium]|nr:hypothetical protein [Oscillospiraceae bacterium]